MDSIRKLGWTITLCALLAAGCGDDDSSQDGDIGADGSGDGANDGDGDGDGDGLEVPDTYAFASRFDSTKSSVSYSGQTMRFVIIEAISKYLDELTDRIDTQAFKPAAGDVRDILLSYYEFDDAQRGADALPLEGDVPFVQATFAELSSGKKLKDKFAGNGGDAEHADFQRAFEGVEGQQSAEGYLLSLFEEVDALAVARAGGSYAFTQAEPVYLSADGRDLREMIEKLLLVGVAYIQTTDKYLDEEVEEATNVREAGDTESLYTPLEHAWDEGFGYFGAARDYGVRSDADIAGAPMFDTNGDGEIDVLTEVSFSSSVYAARRDNDSNSAADFTGEVWDAFVKGRTIIANAGDELTSDEKTALLEQRDRAVNGLEKVLAANVVHYINSTLSDLAAFGTADFDLGALGAHFSEMKAFALGLQFKPGAKLTSEKFAALHQGIGDRPVVPNNDNKADVDAYVASLLKARDLIQEAYGFSDADVGDDAGQGGW